ncbi:MAG: hypothetical protein QOI31_1692 [Solirubrobacterales bacterium]|nr:hypothetical protein [Solirubrobacterales bacterium]
MAVPVVALAVFAFAGRFVKAEAFSILATGLLALIGAMAVGGLIGFLFGLPRTSTETSSGRLKSNTNLERVSDWLTTILIGIGLIEIDQLAQGIGDAADEVALGLGSTGSPSTVALALILYGLIGGFVGSYVLTRVTLTIRLDEVEAHLEAKQAVRVRPDPGPLPPLPKPPPPPPPPGQPLPTQPDP